MNRSLGWWLLFAAFAWGAWADVTHLIAADPTQAISAARLHAWLVALGFSHLLLAWAPLPATVRRRSLAFTGGGTLLGVVSLLLPVPPVSLGLRGISALMNLIGSSFASRRLTQVEPFGQRLRLVAVGFLIDLCVVSALLFAPNAGDAMADLSLRMALLARMAAVALPLLATLSEEPEERPSSSSPAAWLDLCAFSMTTILLGSSHTEWLKFLLPFPAVGAAICVWQATLRCRAGVGWTTVFWLLTAVSVTAGLVVGLFAFNSPVPSPAGMEEYAGLMRRLCRHAHIALLVTGITGLALVREGVCRPLSRVIFPLFLAGGLLTAALPFVPHVPLLGLALGPVLQVVALGMGIRLLARRNPETRPPVGSDSEVPYREPL